MGSVYGAGLAVLKSTLLANATLTALVTDTETGIVKIYAEFAPQGIKLPYITIQHYVGGEDNDAQSRALDMMYKVYAHTDDVATARQLEAAIAAALHRQMPVCDAFNAQSTLKVEGYTWITLLYPDYVNYIVQTRMMIEIGGIYRLRLSVVET